MLNIINLDYLARSFQIKNMSRENKKNKISIPMTFFPKDGVENTDSESFGLKVGKSIQYEWFHKSSGSCKFYSQAKEFRNRRLYAAGRQSIAKYKSQLVSNTDLSYIHMDWKIIPVIPKFVDIIANGVNSRLMYVRAEAQDAMAAEEKNSMQKMVKADMLARPFLEQAMSELGVNGFNIDPNELPENDEELSLFMQLKFKPRAEIATEVAISNLMDMNNYNEIRERTDLDQITLGLSGVRHSFTEDEGVKVSYLDPESTVYSTGKARDFSDRFYFGTVELIHKSEIFKINPTLTDEDIKMMSGTASMWAQEFPEYRDYLSDHFSSEMIPVLFFNYKATKTFVYKKKRIPGGGYKMIEKDYDFNPEENEMYSRVEKRKVVWYSGAMALGSNKLLKWELLQNGLRSKSPTGDPLPEFIMYASRPMYGGFDSIVNRMMPIADQIQLTHLKLQQVQSKIVPDGVMIDVDGINSINLGGKKYDPEDALQMYFETGSVLGRSMNIEGEFNHGKQPIFELNKNSGNAKIASLIQSYNHYLNQLRDVSGLNSGTDASTPSPNALVGVQKMAALNSNTATQHILKSALSLCKMLGNALYLRISDILRYSDNAEEFANQIGKYNVDLLKDITNMHLHTMGIYIDMSPDPEEREFLERDIQLALGKQLIGLEDAMDIRSVKNIKIASELLKIKRKRRQKQEQDREDAIAQRAAESNMASAEHAKNAKLQVIQAEAVAKTMILQKEAEYGMQTSQFEAELKSKLMDQEFSLNVELAKITSGAQLKRDDMKEQKKSDRIKEQATVTSELNEQKAKGLPAKRFESSNDSLDGLSLEEFSPR